MIERPLYCIVATREQALKAVPDLGSYAPKELADKENVSVTTVYKWIKDGLPVTRRGERGTIKIWYQDYVQWMIDCARNPDCGVSGVPVWAYWFIRYGGKVL